jgi:hypothetical protein
MDSMKVVHDHTARKPSPRVGRFMEGLLYFVEAAVWIGAISGTSISILLGKYLLAMILSLIALGMILRLKRGRAER